jgi:hypothetical protein
LKKKRVGEILQGKTASKSGREFAPKLFSDATKVSQMGQSSGWLFLYLIEKNGGRDRTRTCDLLRVKLATLAISLSIQ